MIYSISRAILTVLFKFLYRFSVKGVWNVPLSGPVVLVANHISYLDPPAVGVAVPRPIAFMAKEELFRIPVVGWYIGRMGSFPVKRGTADREAIRTAVERLGAGEIVGVFPQGGRVREGVTEAFPGAALLAYKAGVPVLPAAVWGTDRVFPDGARFPRFPRITVSIGRPITVDTTGDKKRTIRETTDRILQEINVLLREAGQDHEKGRG